MESRILERARLESGLSQDELAELAGTSRTTISAYEHGRKSPTLSTASRLLASAGFELSVEPTITFHEIRLRHGRPIFVADKLWRLPIRAAMTTVHLPLGLNWSKPGTTFELSDRRQRSRCYEIVLREGSPTDIRQYIDGALLIDAWPDLVLPRDLRAAWQPVIDTYIP
jgi:transcriptional regulator with XRE-family HTH domain